MLWLPLAVGQGARQSPWQLCLGAKNVSGTDGYNKEIGDLHFHLPEFDVMKVSGPFAVKIRDGEREKES